MADYTIILEGSEKKIKLLQTLAEEIGIEYHVKKKGKKEKKRKLTRKQQEFVEGIKEALHEVELSEQGKIRLKTLQEVLDEL